MQTDTSHLFYVSTSKLDTQDNRALAAQVRLRLIQGFGVDHLQLPFPRIGFRVAPHLATHKEGDLGQLRLAIGAPHEAFQGWSGRCGLVWCGLSRFFCALRGSSFAQVAAVAIDELKIVAEHANQVLLQAHHQGMHPRIKDHIRPFPAHLG